MGVHVGDDPVFNFPSFVQAASDEAFDRLKKQFYEKKSNLLPGMPARVSDKTIFAETFVGNKNATVGSFLLDAFVFYRGIRRRGLFLGLEIKKPVKRSPTFYGF